MANVRQFLIAAGFSGAVLSGGVMIATEEALVTGSYLDPVDIITACYGHTSPTLTPGQTFTEEQCLAQLAKDLVRYNNQLMSLTRQVQLTDQEHAAYLSFIYNIGAGAFSTSTLRKKLLAGDRVEACQQLSRWVYAKGKKLSGLVIRRERERNLCLQGSAHADMD
ncbi:lysozyme [Shewanella sp.]|uniref:lysozyme n=1 Tax=Shewanella sp. TaxID=50422 RepID=UPI003D0AD918